MCTLWKWIKDLLVAMILLPLLLYRTAIAATAPAAVEMCIWSMLAGIRTRFPSQFGSLSLFRHPPRLRRRRCRLPPPLFLFSTLIQARASPNRSSHPSTTLTRTTSETLFRSSPALRRTSGSRRRHLRRRLKPDPPARDCRGFAPLPFPKSSTAPLRISPKTTAFSRGRSRSRLCRLCPLSTRLRSPRFLPTCGSSRALLLPVQLRRCGMESLPLPRAPVLCYPKMNPASGRLLSHNHRFSRQSRQSPLTCGSCRALTPHLLLHRNGTPLRRRSSRLSSPNSSSSRFRIRLLLSRHRFPGCHYRPCHLDAFLLRGLPMAHFFRQQGNWGCRSFHYRQLCLFQALGGRECEGLLNIRKR